MSNKKENFEEKIVFIENRDYRFHTSNRPNRNEIDVIDGIGIVNSLRMRKNNFIKH